MTFEEILNEVDNDTYIKVNHGKPITVENYKKKKDFNMYSKRKLRRPITVVIDLDEIYYLERKCLYFVI